MLNYYKYEVPIYTSILDVTTTDVKRYISRVYEIGDEMEKKTNVQADMSNYNLHRSENTFHPLLKKIVENVKLNFPIKGLVNLEYIEKENNDFIVQNFWSALYRGMEYTVRHNHLGSYIAFCYYLQVDKFSSPLNFDDLNLEIKPQNNMLVVFPAYLNHSVPKQKKEGEDRIILAGNILLQPKQADV